MSQLSEQSSILLISCYELGHQPTGIAMPLGFLRRAGYKAEAMDVSVEGFDTEKIKRARFVGISVPMHTALRLGRIESLKRFAGSTRIATFAFTVCTRSSTRITCSGRLRIR